MSDDQGLSDNQIIQAAYAERVADAFKVFAENLNTGQSEQSCTLRFVRALEVVRRTRDLALRAAVHGMPASAADTASAAAPEAAEPLSAEDQALIESALSGTTGRHAPPPSPMPPRYRG